MRVPRPLDEVEIRVLGSLLEKEQLTPDAYPLTLHQLLAACNQKTSREPVMTLGESEVSSALERLREHALVWRSSGARVERWEHSLDRRWELEPASKAVMTVLLLRGAQTPGELRQRCERMYEFASPAALEAVLRRLAAGEAPLVTELPLPPGKKESRWIHLVGEGAEAARPAAGGAPAPSPGGWESRLAALEARVAELERLVQSLSGASQGQS